MKKINWIFALALLVFAACKKEEIPDTNTTDPPVIEEPSLLTGYNMRWRDTPDFDDSRVVELIDSLNPKVLRYPGGTLAHKWNWQTGLPENPSVNDVPHPIEDVKILAEATDSKVIFVLDIINRTVADQIEMIKSSGIAPEFIELGNELYADDYEAIFPEGKTYAETVNEWTPILQNEFPDAKIGAVMLGRTAGNDRKNNWNTSVHENITANVDAYIYHIYVNETETVQNRIERFNTVFLENTGKKLWITEYGAKSQDLVQALAISDFVDSIADIALNHCVVSRSGSFSKMTIDGNQLTEEGRAFSARYLK